MSKVMQISALVIVVAVMIIVATYTGRDDSFEPAQVDSAAPTVQLPTTPTGTVIPDSLASTGPEETAATPTGVNPTIDRYGVPMSTPAPAGLVAPLGERSIDPPGSMSPGSPQASVSDAATGVPAGPDAVSSGSVGLAPEASSVQIIGPAPEDSFGPGIEMLPPDASDAGVLGPGPGEADAGVPTVPPEASPN